MPLISYKRQLLSKYVLSKQILPRFFIKTEVIHCQRRPDYEREEKQATEKLSIHVQWLAGNTAGCIPDSLVFIFV